MWNWINYSLFNITKYWKKDVRRLFLYTFFVRNQVKINAKSKSYAKCFFCYYVIRRRNGFDWNQTRSRKSRDTDFLNPTLVTFFKIQIYNTLLFVICSQVAETRVLNNPSNGGKSLWYWEKNKAHKIAIATSYSCTVTEAEKKFP